MEQSTIAIIVALIALLISIITYFISKQKPQKETPPPTQIQAYNTIPLQLQAYERLVLLCERISIPNLISRLNQPQFSAREMQVMLIENIKQEFEYNATQQLYVSDVAWEAVRNLRDQSMLIINQVANILPAEARANDLSKQLLDVIMNQKEAALHTIVLNALNFEAKKLMR